VHYGSTTAEVSGGVRAYGVMDVIAWSNASATTTMVAADYLYVLPNMNNVEVFAGLSLGTATFEIDMWDSGDSSATGIQFGALYKTGKDSDYEIGYRMINTAAESTYSAWFGDYAIELSSITQLYVGANWYF
jgi:hypothetical protein